jgi:hypothetical protein
MQALCNMKQGFHPLNYKAYKDVSSSAKTYANASLNEIHMWVPSGKRKRK